MARSDRLIIEAGLERMRREFPGLVVRVEPVAGGYRASVNVGPGVGMEFGFEDRTVNGAIDVVVRDREHILAKAAVR